MKFTCLQSYEPMASPTPKRARAPDFKGRRNGSPGDDIALLVETGTMSGTF
jgi:hypothetical protein